MNCPLGLGPPRKLADNESQLFLERVLFLLLHHRYHVAGGNGVFFARRPYANSTAVPPSGAEAAAVTRFIGLANVGNATKQVS